MKTFLLREMQRGWFVGGFDPVAFKTNQCEVAVKRFLAGDTEAEHFHRVATEITVVISGTVKMFGRLWQEGDIIIVEPKDVTSFESITDSVITVVKVPGVLNDKYLTDNQ